MSPARSAGARLVILRHAPAEHRNPRLWPNDDDRPLRRSGRPEFLRSVRGLAKLLGPKGPAATSPLLRARQTAEVLGGRWRPAKSPQVWTELRPEVPAADALARIARTIPGGGGEVLVVGHEPQLSRLIGLAVSGEAVPLIRCSKGGAIAIDFSSAVTPGGGQIAWALTRGQLARLSARRPREVPDDEG